MRENNGIVYYEDVVKQPTKRTASFSSDAPEEDNDNDAGVAEFYQVLSLAMVGVAYLTQDTTCAWLCLLFFFSSIINFKFVHMTQQMMTSFTLVTVAFSQSYIAPNKK